MKTSIAVYITVKAGYYHLLIRYFEECCWIYYWQGTGIKETCPKYLAEQAQRRVLAELYEENRQEQLCEHWGLDSRIRRQSVSQWLAIWLNNRKDTVCERTFNAYRRVINEVGSLLDSIVPELRLLTPQAVENYIQSLYQRGLALKTIHFRHTLLRAALQAACNCGFLRSNPANAVALCPVQRNIPQPYSREELSGLLQACQDTPLHLPILLAVVYGLRRGEVCGLYWEDIDFENGLIHIRRNTVMEHDTSGRCRMICSETMKTEASRRSYPLHPEIERLLRIHLATASSTVGSVFPCQHGGPMRPDTLSAQFRRLLREHGLRPIRFHDLRHTCATQLASSGCDLSVIQGYMGHASPVTTLQYIHSEQDSNCHSLDLLERALARTC